MSNWNLSGKTLYGGTFRPNGSIDGDGTGFIDEPNRFWAVGLKGSIDRLPGEGSMNFNDMFGYMDSPSQRNPIPPSNNDNGLGIMRLLMNGNFAPSPQLNPSLSNYGNELPALRGMMGGLQFSIPPSTYGNELPMMRGMRNGLQFNVPPSTYGNELSMMRSLMDGPLHNVVYTENNNPIDFLRERMDAPPLNFNGLNPMQFISALVDGSYNGSLPPTAIDRVANQFRPNPPIEPVVLQQIRVPGPQVKPLDGYF